MSNIDWNGALAPEAPPAVVMPASELEARVAADELRTMRPNTIVRTIDATRCSTTPDFLVALATALEFPDEDVNWNIVEERLYDMTWYPAADAYVVILLNCERFITATSAHDLPILDRILAGILEDQRTDDHPKPHRLVCQCAPSRLDEFVRLLQRLDVRWRPAPSV